MKRRDFLNAGLAGVAAMATPAGLKAGPVGGRADGGSAPTFKLNYAPHFGMFRAHAGEDLISQLRFMHEQGFRALEDNGMRGRPVEVQERIGRELARLGMQMGVFVAHTIVWDKPTITLDDPSHRENFLREIRESVDVAKRVNAKWMTVVPGHLDLRRDIGFQTANVIETLKRASDILEPHGLVMVMEPLNPRDHPGLFLRTAPQGYALAKAVDSPATKVLYDIYHEQISGGNLIPSMERAWDEIAYLQIGDNPGRKEPTTGEINYENVFKWVHKKGFRGVLGMEHGNSRPGKEGELEVIRAYRQVDSFDDQT